MAQTDFKNPFRPGAGHPPPYLAGREPERREFEKLLEQDTILENAIITGLRGVGKTVLLDSFKPLAIGCNWLWVGTDLSESTSVKEETVALRLLTDLSVVTAKFIVSNVVKQAGFHAESYQDGPLTFETLRRGYDGEPGLVADKLKSVLCFVWECVRADDGHRGIVFAYDEAQTMSDHSGQNEYPLSLLLDVFQSLQRKDIPFMLVLVGLPTLFPKLVDARTYSERMFRILFLESLSETASREAIIKPIEDASCPVELDPESIETIIEVSGGYPYFIQFICREVYDAFLQGTEQVPVDEIQRKLDTDFFAGRWGRATDRQRDILTVIAHLKNSDSEFTVHDVVKESKKRLEKPFSSSHANQMLAGLGRAGLVYKNRHGKYSLAVPLLGPFILRQASYA